MPYDFVFAHCVPLYGFSVWLHGALGATASDEVGAEEAGA